MEIRQLEALTAVVASGSVTAAGRLLERSQPVVSRQISDLEDELGFSLFTRTRPSITLTPQGAEFYQDVRRVMADLELLEARGRDIARGLTSPLHIVATSDMMCSILPQVLQRVDSVEPLFESKLMVEEVSHNEVAAVLIEGHADLCVINLPIEHEACQVHWCGQAPCMLAVPPGHALATRDTVRLEDLIGDTIITLPASYRLRYHLASALVKAADAPRHIEVGSHQAALAMVRAHLGVALVDPFTTHGIPLDGVALRPVNVHIPYMVGVVSQHGRSLSNEAMRLIEGLRNYVLDHVPYFVETNANGLPVNLGRGGRRTVHTG
ncbi:MAG: LysR family transcriptional regulator [Alcaligenaceae bacterium]|nr:LysR family transcriptional regulator [Alcaligenaceae bacterium]